MHISFDTNELTPLDKQVLSFLAGEGEWPTATTPEEPAPVAKTKPKAPKAEEIKPEPVVEPEATPEPEPEEDLLGGEETAPEPDGPTMADAVAAATKLVSSGGAAKVKEALAAVGAKRVSEIPEDKISEFLSALQ